MDKNKTLFFKEMYDNRKLIMSLSKNDFKTKFAGSFLGGTNSLIEYNYLVKKVVFNMDILPTVKVISSLFVHLFFTAFITVLCWCYGYKPDLYWLQVIYYILCMFILVLGISYLTSAVVCFFRDLTQIIGIILQVGVWLTPIMWDTAILSPKLALIFKLNPMYYIVDGFRDALLYKASVVDKPLWTAYFWIFTVVTFILGIRVFKKLKIHFADIM